MFTPFYVLTCVERDSSSVLICNDHRRSSHERSRHSNRDSRRSEPWNSDMNDPGPARERMDASSPQSWLGRDGDVDRDRDRYRDKGRDRRRVHYSDRDLYHRIHRHNDKRHRDEIVAYTEDSEPDSEGDEDEDDDEYDDDDDYDETEYKESKKKKLVKFLKIRRPKNKKRSRLEQHNDDDDERHRRHHDTGHGYGLGTHERLAEREEYTHNHAKTNNYHYHRRKRSYDKGILTVYEKTSPANCKSYTLPTSHGFGNEGYDRCMFHPITL